MPARGEGWSEKGGGGRKGRRVGCFSAFLTSFFFVTPPEQFSRVSLAAGAVSKVRDAVIRLDRNNRAADRVQRLGRVSSTQTENRMDRQCAAAVLPTFTLSPRSPHSFFSSFLFFFFFFDSVPTDKKKGTWPITRNSSNTLEKFARFLLGFTVVSV